MSMIEINDNCAIEIVLGATKFFKTNFVKLLVKQEADNVIPRFQLELEMPTTEILLELKKNNTIIELNYGNKIEEIVKREFRVKNHRLYPSGDKFKVIITGILDVSDYTNKLNIVAIKKTSDAVLSEEIAGVDLDISYTGVDEQVWIRHNIPEKEFVDRVLQYAYIADDDLVLSALNLDKKLRIVSVKDEFAKKEVINLMNDVEGGSESDVRFQSLSVETDDSIFKYLLSEGTLQPVYHLKDGEVEYIETNGRSVKDGSTSNELSESRNAPMLVDNGNCHGKYYNAYAVNLSNKVNIFSYNVIVTVTQKFFKESELSLLDIVKILPNKVGSEIEDTIKGKYMLTSKDTVISQKGFVQELRLNRDYML